MNTNQNRIDCAKYPMESSEWDAVRGKSWRQFQVRRRRVLREGADQLGSEFEWRLGCHGNEPLFWSLPPTNRSVSLLVQTPPTFFFLVGFLFESNRNGSHRCRPSEGRPASRRRSTTSRRRSRRRRRRWGRVACDRRPRPSPAASAPTETQQKKKPKKMFVIIFFRMKTGDVIGRSARDWPSINGSHRSKRGNERNERTNDQRAAVYWERK